MTGAFLVVVPGAQAAQLVVDDNAAQCPGAPFTTIQSAVNAAAAGDTIAVCAGTYTEGTAVAGNNALTINKSVNIRGVGADSVIIQPAGDVGEPDPDGSGVGPSFRDARGNVVSVGSTTATAATAVTVNISGVTVRGNDRYVESGVSFLNASGGVTNSRVTGIVQSQAGLGRFGILQRGFGVLALSTVPGNFTFALTNSEVDSYNKAGLLVDSNSVATSKVQATITGDRIQGGGKITPGLGQNGIQVSQGAGAVLTANTITDNNFFDPMTAVDSAAGVLLFAADLTTTSVNGNNIQGNSFGLTNVDINGAVRTATPVSAINTWWGNPNGPSITTQQVDRGDPVDTAVTFLPFRNTPLAQAAAPGTPADAAPTVSVTAPADGATVTPGVAAPVTATAADDLGVVSVTFRKGATVLGTDTTAPYTAAYTPTAAEAGTSQAITATAQDTKGQTAASAISVRVAGGVANAPEDRPPVIAFASPAENALLPATGANLVVNAADDRGVANVRFIDDNQTVCTDNAAPFTCAYKPQGDDVGRNTLIAIATDGAGQTAVAIRTVRVNRFTPRSLSSTTTRRDRRAPYRFTTKGTLGLPAGVTRAQGCGAGNVSVQVKRGSTTLSTRRVTLRSNCTYSSTVTFANRRRLGKSGRLKFTARFTGNTVLGRRTAASDSARAG